MSCLRKYWWLCRLGYSNKSISSRRSNTETAATLYAKHSAGISNNSSAVRVLFALAISLAANSSPSQCQELKQEIKPDSHKVISLVKTERIWKPRKWHLTEKHWFYKVDGKTEPVMLLQKLKDVPSDIKRKIDWHSLINTGCTLLVTGLQCYQATRKTSN